MRGLYPSILTRGSSEVLGTSSITLNITPSMRGIWGKGGERDTFVVRGRTSMRGGNRRDVTSIFRSLHPAGYGVRYRHVPTLSHERSIR